MDHETAEGLVRTLAACTPGWSVESVKYTTDNIEQQWRLDRTQPENRGLTSDAMMGIDAIDAICNTWTHAHRPPWAVIRESWHRTVQYERTRRDMALRPDDNYVPSDSVTALAAARRGYEQDCRAMHKEPDWVKFTEVFRALIASIEKGAGSDDPIQPHGF